MRKIFEIAIFILATTRWFQKDSSWDARIINIHNTWGQHIEHLYFVFGTNVFDYKFLRKNCQVAERYGDESDSSFIDASIDSRLGLSIEGGRVHNSSYSSTHRYLSGRRHLLASSPQTSPANKSVLFRCSDQLSVTPPSITKISPDTDLTWNSQQNNPPDSKTRGARVSSSSKISSLHTSSSPYINALWTGNCTGEYFGFGPTCRCQESLRYMQTLLQTKFKAVEWFMFMDDDVYIRPHSLAAMLNQFNINFHYSKELALIYNATSYRGFKFSKVWDPKQVDCKIDGVHSFAIAMPAIVNRKALDILFPAIDANGMTELQAIWGGTHDAILGLLLWMYRIDTYTLSNMYYEKDALTTENMVRINRNNTLFVHRIKNIMLYRKGAWGPNMTTPPVGKKRPSQYDLQAYFGDSEVDETAAMKKGVELTPHLVKLLDSGVHKTIFAERAAEMKTLRKFHTYRLEDCKLL